MSAAPASSPIPCTTLNAPSGSPASRVMSASSEAVSGAHSGGLSTTLLPAASAGAMRHVASISGAFHGRDHDGDAGRVPLGPAHELVHLERLVAELGELVGEEAEVPRDARHDRVQVRAQERAVVARLDRRELGDALLDELGDPVQDLGAVGRRGPPPRVERAPGRRDGSVDLGRAAAGDLGDDLLVDRRDVAKVSDEPTRSPPIQCSVETSTPSISAVPPVGAPLLGEGRSVPNDRNDPAEMSNDGASGAPRTGSAPRMSRRR